MANLFDHIFVKNSEVETVVKARDIKKLRLDIHVASNRPDKVYKLRKKDRFTIAFVISIMLALVIYFYNLYIIATKNFVGLGWMLSAFMLLIRVGHWLDKTDFYIYCYDNLPNKVFNSKGGIYDFDLIEEMEPPFYISFFFAFTQRSKHYIKFKNNGIQTQLEFVDKEDAVDLYQRWYNYKHPIPIS